MDENKNLSENILDIKKLDLWYGGNHALKDVNMDCGSCGLQEICDEIEGLREMHFGMSEEHT